MPTQISGIVAVTLIAYCYSASAPVTPGTQARAFLGGASGCMVYTKWEGSAGYSNGRSLWFVDFSEETLIERRIVLESATQPMNAMISPDGKWVVYNTNTSPPQIFLCRLQENAEATKVLVGNGAQPHWWKSGSGEEFIVFNEGDMTDLWQTTWQQSGHTYSQKIDPATKRPIGPSQILVSYYANGGRSKSGEWLFSSGRATGIYAIDPAASANAPILTVRDFGTELGCNPSISPHIDDAEVLVLQNGAADKSSLGFEGHTYMVIRRTDGSIVKAPRKDPADGNRYCDAPEWSTHENFATFAASAADLTPPYDIYILRISDATSLRVLDGNCFWPHLWVDPGTAVKRSSRTDAPHEIVKPGISILSPKGGEHFRAGDTLHIRWSAVGCLQVSITISFDAGLTYKTLGGPGMDDPAWGDFPWVIGDSLFDAATVSDSCIVKVINYTDRSISDESDSFFAIHPIDWSDDAEPARGNGCGSGLLLSMVPLVYTRVRRKCTCAHCKSHGDRPWIQARSEVW